MIDVAKILEERKVPDALILKSGRRVKNVKDFEKRREEIKKILEEEAYGVIPPKPDHMRVDVESVMDNFCAGKAPWQKLNFICTLDGKEFSFPVSAVIPKSDKPLPAFVHINFRDAVPDRYMPSEELVDRGYAVFSFCYTDVSSDDGNFKDKCAKYLSNRRRKNGSSTSASLLAAGSRSRTAATSSFTERANAFAPFFILFAPVTALFTSISVFDGLTFFAESI